MERVNRPIIPLHRATPSDGHDVETLGLEAIASQAEDVLLSISTDLNGAHGRTDLTILEDLTA
jgi:hypothetical protein